MQITFIGHATLLLEIGRVRVLTDPNFESSLGGFLPRVAAPGVTIEALPPLDAMLLTHAHADHLSFKSLDLLSRDIPLYAPSAVASWLQGKGYENAVSIAAGTETSLAGTDVTLHATQATHQGNRYGFDRWRRVANMYLLESAHESVFFAGDTALTSSTHEIVDRVLWQRGRQLDVALLPIGWAPAWKPGFRRGHLTGDDALALFDRLDARALMPYHWGTFQHVTASAHAAIDRFRDRLESYPHRDRVHIIEPGQSLTVAPRES